MTRLDKDILLPEAKDKMLQKLTGPAVDSVTLSTLAMGKHPQPTGCRTAQVVHTGLFSERSRPKGLSEQATAVVKSEKDPHTLKG